MSDFDGENFDRGAEVYKHLSEEGMWISPVYNEESRRYIAEELVGGHIIDNEDYEPADGSYTIVSLFSGSSLLDQEILDRYESSEVPVNMKAIDMAPPGSAKRLEEDYEGLEIIEGDVTKELEEIDDVDGIIAIDGFQELNDEEMFGGENSEGLADDIVNSLEDGGYLISNSTHEVIEVFRDFEEWAEEDYKGSGEGFVRIDEEGEEYVHVDSATIEGIEIEGEKHDITTSVIQTPRPYDEHVSKFEERGLKEMESGEIEAHAGGIEEIAESIDEDIPISDDEDPRVSYPYGVMKAPGKG